ncbi:hypothetical protein RHSIM_Rhsim12G0147400 [Rhododendron simsii]|uniref:Uncharacterized protein n=1 Tax=Rhododendron simsii TaxID=118357 RepID=A0A834G505_RHOSS|nr:hypothetical protein RHSIM_Rhsim12G0147400 [Rhododendron simsii]
MSNTSAHILVYPFPAPGHIIPLLDLTRLLLTRGLTVTVLVSPSHLALLQPLLSSHASVQPLVLSSAPEPNSSSAQLSLPAKIRATAALYDPILQWFRSHARPPVAIVSDFFLGWTHRLATDLGVPRVAFWPSGAFAASVYNSLWRDLPTIPRTTIRPTRIPWGAVFNSFTELERVYIDHVKKEMGHKKVWAVGPLLPPNDDPTGPANRGGSSAVPAHEVMTWLDGKRDESVVYVCFGSRVELTSEQTEALAAALERSEVNFIWCVQEHAAGRGGSIPEGFGKRVGERGFIVRGWAPQVAILSHRAVGVFVTHCGWNSVLEGVAAGVLLLTWPMGADQFIDANLLVDQLGLAVRACEGGVKNIPNLGELTRLLTESASGTRPERTRVKEMREAAWNAVKGGSSTRDLDELVEKLSELSKNI